MFSSGMAIPYFAQLIANSKVVRFALALPSSSFSYLIALILGLFFVRLFFYVFYASKTWKKKEDLTFQDLNNLCVKTNQKLPFFTILIPALEEAEVIASTIQRVAQINYPSDCYQIRVIVDEKEKLRAKSNQITTRQVVEDLINKFRNQPQCPKLNLLEVPYDFDGYLNGQCLSKEVPSTKGRALNYALSQKDEITDFYAFFDAEAGPNPGSFLAVAKSYLLNNKNIVFQLPVYQIRNFWSLNAFCKVAALSQCFSHQYVLPFIFIFMPFIGGTNLFIHRSVILKNGGFDNTILTEDIELGVRLYVEQDLWPIYLPYPSTEQTPPTLSAYHKQRYRWGFGLMQTMQKLFRQLKETQEQKSKEKHQRIKKMIYSLSVHGPIDWILYYPLTLAATLLFLMRVFKSAFISFILYHFSTLTLVPWNPLNDALSLILVFIPIPTLVFLIVLLKHYWSYINHATATFTDKRKQLINLAFFVLFGAPLSMSYYVFPYVHAFFNFVFHPHQQTVWIKTQRTKEVLT
ncbi:MAG: hypothetical protein QG648_28 [Patescibacteria group bacterium]|nr:hypothetical protein [Patescibacteria group bacterium]